MSSVVEAPTGFASTAAAAVRSRRYASTVRGASLAAETARNASTSGSRMGSVIDAAEPPAVDVGIHLRCRERAVAEQLLDHAQVGAALEQMGRECVPEAMRVGDEPPQRARVQAAAARREKERLLGAARELGARLVHVAGEPVGGLLAERHRPFLAALAADMHELLVEVDVGEVEVDRLAAAQSG